ncbi:hypothetical protein SAMN05216331_10785 [Porphyromonadaceae bacterium KH3R12]|nr:hypothetical protein SAMN05216331_10785 [Porphyromonadaceae bacterium KH3R12]
MTRKGSLFLLTWMQMYDRFDGDNPIFILFTPIFMHSF